MSQEITPFEAIRRTNPAGNEFWSSRDFARVLGYVNYRHFQAVIEKARVACFNSGQRVEDHFVGSDQMIEIGKGGQRAVQTVMMSRYACYLVIQNADPAKEIVAQGQTYFAIQTRRQELSDEEMEEQRRLAIRADLRSHNSQLADAAKGAGVIESRDYAIFQNHGYMGLYGGLGAQDIHHHAELPLSQDQQHWLQQTTPRGVIYACSNSYGFGASDLVAVEHYFSLGGDMPDPRGGVRHVIPEKANYLVSKPSASEFPPPLKSIFWRHSSNPPASISFKYQFSPHCVTDFARKRDQLRDKYDNRES